MKKYIILFTSIVLLLFLFLISSFENIEKENELNAKTQNSLYQAFLDKDIETIDKILVGTKFYHNDKIFNYNESVRDNIKEFLEDDSKYIDIKKISFSASNMYHERPLHFLIWNSNDVYDISHELWWEVEYRDGKLYSIKSDNNDLLFEYLFINNNKKDVIKTIKKE